MTWLRGWAWAVRLLGVRGRAHVRWLGLCGRMHVESADVCGRASGRAGVCCVWSESDRTPCGWKSWTGVAPPIECALRAQRRFDRRAREERESVESRGGRDGARGTGLSRSTATGAPCTAATLTSVAAPKLPKSARGPTPYLYRRPPRYTVRTSCKNIIHFTCMATRCRRYESTLSRRALARGPRWPRAALADTPSASPRLVTDVELRFHTPRQSVLHERCASRPRGEQRRGAAARLGVPAVSAASRAEPSPPPMPACPRALG